MNNRAAPGAVETAEAAGSRVLYRREVPAATRFGILARPMELYIYRTPGGIIADFRPYLDGRDHSFDDHRPLKREDPRWEKILNLVDPETDEPIGGRVEFIGKAQCPWHELMKFPVPWREAFEPVDWEAAGAAGASA